MAKKFKEAGLKLPPGGRKPRANRFRPRLSPQQRDAIKYGYPQLGATAVARMFKITPRYAHYLRGGERGHGERVAEWAKLAKIECRWRAAAEAEVAIKFLAKATPLLRNVLLALDEASRLGVVETSLDEVEQERWNAEVRRAVEREFGGGKGRGVARATAWSDSEKPDPAAGGGDERGVAGTGGVGRGDGAVPDAGFLFDRLPEG